MPIVPNLDNIVIIDTLNFHANLFILLIVLFYQKNLKLVIAPKMCRLQVGKPIIKNCPLIGQFR